MDSIAGEGEYSQKKEAEIVRIGVPACGPCFDLRAFKWTAGNPEAVGAVESTEQAPFCPG